MAIIIKYFGLKKTTLFFWIISGHLVLAILSRIFLIDEVVFYNTYSEQLTWERSITLFENLKKLSWIGYIFIPLILLIKFTLITIVIYIGVFFLENKVSGCMGKIFGVVIASEIIFIIAGFVKFLWFCFFAGNYDLNDLSFFFPLSLTNFFNYSDVDKIWIFPMQTLNLFQIAYILLLSYGLHSQLGISRQQAEKSILASYLPGLFIVIALLMFISLGKSV